MFGYYRKRQTSLSARSVKGRGATRRSTAESRGTQRGRRTQAQSWVPGSGQWVALRTCFRSSRRKPPRLSVLVQRSSLARSVGRMGMCSFPFILQQRRISARCSPLRGQNRYWRNWGIDGEARTGKDVWPWRSNGLGLARGVRRCFGRPEAHGSIGDGARYGRKSWRF